MMSSSKSNIYFYTKIISLDQSPSANFYGRVVNFKPPRQTRGSDWVMNMVVVDDSFEGRPDLNTPNPAGLSVVIFKKSLEEFPAVQSIGDIVQFRHFRIQYYESNLQALSTNWSAFSVFRRREGQEDSDDDWIVLPDRTILPEEIEIIKIISKMKIGFNYELLPSNNNNTSTTTLTTAATRPILSVSEVRHGIYFNGNFKVIKIVTNQSDNSEIDHQNQNQNQFSMLICDYTENPFLSCNPETIGLPSHLNQCLLPVTLWDNFADEARRINLKAGDFVYLDNLLGRQIRHQTGEVNIVAVLHGDPKVKQIEKFIRIQRENKKIESQAIRLEHLKKSMESEKEIIEAINPIVKDQVIETKINKGERLKQTKRTFAVSVKTEKESNQSNQNIRNFKFITTKISGDSLAISTILSIRSYPTDNAKFCVKARIVSLIPELFYDMVRYICEFCQFSTILSNFLETNSCSNCKVTCETGNPKFIWVFAMVIEDETGDIPMILAEEDAEEFLGFSAFDLTAPENSAQLTHAMSVFEQLSLHSNQSEHLFCIKSYRVDNENGVSHLRYRIFNTKMF